MLGEEGVDGGVDGRLGGVGGELELGRDSEEALGLRVEVFEEGSGVDAGHLRALDADGGEDGDGAVLDLGSTSGAERSHL